MARGNRIAPTRGLIASRKTASSSASATSTFDAGAALDAVIDAYDARADARAQKKIKKLMADEPESDPARDITWPATKQFKALQVAYNGGAHMRERFPELLQQAIAHQRRYIEYLRTQIATAESGTWEMVRANSAVDEANDLRRELEKMKDRDHHRVRDAVRRRGPHLRSETDRLLCSLLIKNDIYDAQRVISAFVARDVSPVSERLHPAAYEAHRLETMAQLVSAEQELGSPPGVLWMLALGDGPGRMSRHLLEEAAGDSVERQLAEGDPKRVIDVADSPERVLAIARAMLRNHEQFTTEGSQADGNGVQLKIPATLPTLARMLQEGIMGHEHSMTILHDRAASPTGSRRHVTVEMRYVFRGPGPDDNRVVSVIGDLGRTARRTQGIGRWSADRLIAEGAEAIATDGYSIRGYSDEQFDDAEGAVVRFMTGDERRRLTEAYLTKTAKDPASVLGADMCDHANATWTAQRSRLRISVDDPPAAACLGCSDCLRTRIAVEPLHRFPAGHEMHQRFTEAIEVPSSKRASTSYLQWRRFYDSLAKRPCAESIDDLVARDGLIEPDPGLYLAAARTPAPGQGRKIRTIRDAMTRR